MKKIMFAFLLLIPFAGISQEFRLVTLGGVATGTNAQEKRLMLSYGQLLQYEFPSHHKLYFNVGIGWGKLTFNNQDATYKTYFNKISYWQLPLQLRKYILLKMDAKFFIDFGTILNYYYKSVSESLAPEVKQNSSLKNINLGYCGGLGYKNLLSRRFGFEFGIHFQNDLLKWNDTNPFKANKMQLFFSFTNLSKK
jgi:hypothetical protein